MKIAIVGCGVMGGAFARQFAKAKHEMILCDRNEGKGNVLAEDIGGKYLKDPGQAAKVAESILLAVKPKDLGEIASELGDCSGKIVVSILSGVSVEMLKKHFPKAHVVRSMPNLALLYGESVIALVENPNLPKEIVEKVNGIHEGLGMVFWTSDDNIAPITAIAGSAPAFIVTIIESMVEAGIMMGLSADLSKDLVLQTLIGAVELVKGEDAHPGAIRWQIASPGGTTITGLKTMEEKGIRSGMIETILATYQRAHEKH